jgi:hypothetical protein
VPRNVRRWWWVAPAGDEQGQGGAPSWYLGETYEVEMRPIKALGLRLLNHIAPSGPAVIPFGK